MEDLIIDLELGTKLVGNIVIAKELLAMLIKDLPSEMVLIEKKFIEKDFYTTLQLLHKLRGALSYCGAPRLTLATTELEKALRNNSSNIPELFSKFKSEIELVITYPTL